MYPAKIAITSFTTGSFTVKIKEPKLPPVSVGAGTINNNNCLFNCNQNTPVPEPLTILGSVAALGFGAYAERKRKPSKSSAKDNTKDS